MPSLTGVQLFTVPPAAERVVPSRPLHLVKLGKTAPSHLPCLTATHIHPRTASKTSRIPFFSRNFSTWSFLKTKVLAKGVMLDGTAVSASKASGRHVTYRGKDTTTFVPTAASPVGRPCLWVSTCECSLWS